MFYPVALYCGKKAFVNSDLLQGPSGTAYSAGVRAAVFADYMAHGFRDDGEQLQYGSLNRKVERVTNNIHWECGEPLPAGNSISETFLLSKRRLMWL